MTIRAIQSATFPGCFFDACDCDRCGEWGDAYVTEHSAEAVVRLASARLQGRGWRPFRRADGTYSHACPDCVLARLDAPTAARTGA